MFTVTRRSHFRSVTRAALIALTVGLSAAAGVVQAAPTDATSVTVTYGDLNLATSAGNSTLYARIVSAARTACDAADLDNRDLRAFAVERSCEQRAIMQAVADVHSSTLAALVDERQPRG